MAVLSATANAREKPMADTIKAGTILIKEGTVLPKALRFESEPWAPGWSFLKNFDGYGLGRKIQETGWTFFCLAGDMKAIVFGFDEPKAVRRAVKRILARLKGEKFNSLEVAAVASKRFLGVRYVTVYAHSRHIQESAFLSQAEDHQERDRARMGGRLNQVIGVARGRELAPEEMKAAKRGNELEYVIV